MTTKGRDELLAVINKTAEKTDAARAKRKNKVGGDALILVWNDAALDTYGKGVGVMPTLKTMGMLSRAIKRVQGDADYKKDFIRWVVVNWKDALERAGYTGPKYSKEPDLKLFIAIIDRLHNEYCRRGSVPVVSRNAEKSGNSGAEVADLKRQIAELSGIVKTLSADNERLKRRIKILSKG